MSSGRAELGETSPALAAARQQRWRRVLDRVVAGTGLVLLSPVFAGLALAVKLADGGPVFFAHRRVGQGGRSFGLLKFRTMVPHAHLLGGALTAAGDPRLTRPGRWLRRSKLDELPQLINIWRGDMRFVGPRPEVERYVNHRPEEYAELLVDRPGITDPASLAFRHEEALLTGPDPEQQYLNEILPAKLALSLAYQRRRNLWSDVGIVVRTVARMVR